jgi:hypothetical protein
MNQLRLGGPLVLEDLEVRMLPLALETPEILRFLLTLASQGSQLVM